MTALLYFVTFVVGGTLGLIIGCALAMNARSRLIEEIDEADAAHARCADSQSLALEKLRTVRSVIAGNKTVRTSRIAEVIGE